MGDSARAQRDSETLQVRVPRGTMRRLDELAVVKGAMTRSEIVRALLDAGFDHHATRRAE